MIVYCVFSGSRCAADPEVSGGHIAIATGIIAIGGLYAAHRKPPPFLTAVSIHSAAKLWPAWARPSRSPGASTSHCEALLADWQLALVAATSITSSYRSSFSHTTVVPVPALWLAPWTALSASWRAYD